MPSEAARAAVAKPSHIALVGVAAITVVGMLVAPPRARAAVEVHLVAAGDFGGSNRASDVIAAASAETPDALLALGDLSYSTGPEEDWCAWVKGITGEPFPFQLVAGNHEADEPDHGEISNYAACLPNQVPRIEGFYGREYVMDFPSGSPLVRVIAASPNLTFPNSGRWSYAEGDKHYEWVSNAIDEGRSRGAKYIVVATHMPCVSIGQSGSESCASGLDFANLLLDKRVDLWLTGHEHNYMRTSQLALGPGCASINPSATDQDCITSTGGTYMAGQGTVVATVGTGGIAQRAVDPVSGAAGYFEAWEGSNVEQTWGYLDLKATEDSLVADFRGTAGEGFADTFTVTRQAVPPPATPMGLSATATAPNRVELDWDNTASATGYVVLRCTGSACEPTESIGQTSSSNYADTSLEEASDYVYAVAASGAGGDSSPSDSVSVSTPPAQTQSGDFITPAGLWKWRYMHAAPPSDWKSVDFDDTSWNSGSAPLGYGFTGIGTDIKSPPSDQPGTGTAPYRRSAQFRKEFRVDKPSAWQTLQLTSRADDGVAIYLNGTEVARSGMPAGSLTHLTYPTGAPRTSAAAAAPLIADVPVDLLIPGRNVVSAMSNLNYRNTRDVSFEFELKAIPR